ncbi:MAG: U32 family peptidase [Magnetococcus sp. DMHC-6]
MKLSIGPVLFEWGRKGFIEFYRRMAHETPADILYIGEVVCSKRQNLDPDELLRLALEIRQLGKEVVFSTLGLVMTPEEVQTIGEIAHYARQEGFAMEANDMAAISLGEANKDKPGIPMVAGPHITTYNPETVDFLASIGVFRVVPPVELSQKSIQGLFGSLVTTPPLEKEVFAYGRLPLTFSARCYTSRAFHLPKVNCQFKCADFPDGMVAHTQEGQEFLVMNGTETMSGKLFNLAGQVDILREIGTHIVRISPQSRNMVEIVMIWKNLLDRKIDSIEAMARLTEANGGENFCNGYFFNQPGLDFVAM